MKGYMSVFLNDMPTFEEKISVNRGFLFDFDYCIDLYSSSDEKLEYLTNSDEIVESLEESIVFASSVAEDENLEFYESIKNKIREKDFFYNCSRIYLHGEIEEIGEYLSNNYYFLQDREIIIAESLRLDEEILIKLKKNISMYPNIKLKVNGNTEFVSIDDYEATINAIKQIIDKVKMYDYSPFEQLIYAYDLIRDRFYVKENEDERASVSRDLTSSLLGNKIVCLGFANIFKAICDKLELKNCVFCLGAGERGHARNLIHLIDEKYQIDGLYFFDPTFDCKKDEENKFLFSYRFFAKTVDEMNLLDGMEWEPITYKYLSSTDVDELVLTVPEGKLEIEELLRLLSSTKINSLLDLLNEDKINPMCSMTGDDFLEIMYKISDLADIPINSTQFIKALYKVRKQQYYEEPNKYLFDIDVLTCILINSKFIVENETPEDSLLSALGLNRRYTIFTGKDKVQRFMEENGLDKDIERVKLVRTLRTLLEKNEAENKALVKKIF